MANLATSAFSIDYEIIRYRDGVADSLETGVLQQGVTYDLGGDLPRRGGSEANPSGNYIEIVLNLTAERAQALTVDYEIFTARRLNDGSDLGDLSSFDTGSPPIIGLSMAKSAIATSEDSSTNSDLLIGESITYTLAVDWFGGTSGRLISDISVRDLLPDATDPDSIVTENAPTSTTSDLVTWELPDIDGAGSFADTITLTVDSDTASRDEQWRNILDASFTYSGATIDSSTAGFPDISDRQVDHTIREPNPSITTTVSNGGSFSDTIIAEGADSITMRIVVANTGGTAALYDSSVSIPLPADVKAPVVLSSDGGNVAGLDIFGGTISWTNLPAIAPGNSLTLELELDLVDDITLGTARDITSTLSADTLPGNAPAWERTYDLDDDITINTPNPELSGGILATSDLGSSVTDSITAQILVGETATFQFTSTYPLAHFLISAGVRFCHRDGACWKRQLSALAR